ncbi:MAG: hypothetical protein AAF216_00770 [Pseudomonadota bacterium]
MKWVKGILLTVVMLGVIAALFWQFWLKDQVDFLHIAAAFGAKQTCSCVFVAKRSLNSCLNDFTADVSAFTFVESDAAVEASLFDGRISARAEHTPGLGCALVN